jgi:phosphatidylserine/phosphatidylglycerophosphate/cardiolipin synthase-like enzyme
MTIKTLKGHLSDPNENKLANYEVIISIINDNPIIPEKLLVKTSTDINGKFESSYIEADNENIFNNTIKIKLSIRYMDEEIYEINYNGMFVDKIIDFGAIKVEGPNRGVKGRLLDENGKPLSGFVVEAHGEGEIESQIEHGLEIIDKYSPVKLNMDSSLGKTWTDKNGYYEIIYPPSRINNILNKKPNITVIIKDVLGVSELFKTDNFLEVSETIKIIDDIQINRDWAEGWYVTLGGLDKSRFTLDNHIEILIDNQIELETIVKSIESSKSYVYLTQIEFETEFVATFKNSGTPKELMADLLRRTADRGVDVKIILNENKAIPDSFNKIKDYFKSSDVMAREFKTSGLHVMHAKIVIVDGTEAFVIGSPFKRDYWDSNQHLIHDPRSKSGDVGPVHDVSVKLEGGSVDHVEEFFIQMWNYISSEEYDGNNMISPNKPDSNVNKTGTGVPVQITRSITPKTLYKKGELGIFEGYRKAIAEAKDFIYLECQYFTNISIIKALKNAMSANKDLQVIVVMNENPTIPRYKKWQNQCIEKFGIKSFKDCLEHPQISFFTLWTAKTSEEIFEIQQLYVHSKLAIVDDLWATIGTANLDGTSLTHVNEIKGFFDAKFQRSMEINVMIPELGNNSSDENKKLRKNLWSEHLGSDCPNNRPNTGWLGLWQSKALQNIESLNKKEPCLKCQILPYSPEKDVEKQLEDLKISTDRWNVLDSN